MQHACLRIIPVWGGHFAPAHKIHANIDAARRCVGCYMSGYLAIDDQASSHATHALPRDSMATKQQQQTHLSNGLLGYTIHKMTCRPPKMAPTCGSDSNGDGGSNGCNKQHRRGHRHLLAGKQVWLG